MRMNKLGNILIPETEYELIWFAMGDWYALEQYKLFNRIYDNWIANGGYGPVNYNDAE